LGDKEYAANVSEAVLTNANALPLLSAQTVLFAKTHVH
jgi:hypothetical protein